jgi:hypothetical protein
MNGEKHFSKHMERHYLKKMKCFFNTYRENKRELQVIKLEKVERIRIKLQRAGKIFFISVQGCESGWKIDKSTLGSCRRKVIFLAFFNLLLKFKLKLIIFIRTINQESQGAGHLYV